MYKSRELMIIVTFVSLWLTNYFGVDQQAFLAFGLLLSVGLLHGSNDLHLLRRMFKPKTKRSFLLNLTAYVSIVLVAFVLFYMLPFITLIVFIVVSGYHFGEQHWNSKLSKSIWAPVMFVSYGLLILSLLFYLNPGQTSLVIEQLSGVVIEPIWYILSSLFFGGLVLCCLCLVRLEKSISNTDLAFELFLLLVFGIVFTVASLIWAFTIYFIFWHSIPSIKEQLNFLYGTVSKKTTWRYVKSSAVIWLVSLGGLFIFDAIIRTQEQLFITIMFSFLGAITFAHTLIISRMMDKA